MDILLENLFLLKDTKFREFHKKLILSIKEERIIGIRTPVLRDVAKKLIKSGESDAFLEKLPHYYFEENQLHVFIINEIRDFDKCMAQVEKFLPYIDNWATCDQLLPKCFKAADVKPRLIEKAYEWLDSDEEYIVRFAIGILMNYFLDYDFNASYLQRVSEIKSEKYYINMMIAWYFATALAKQYEQAVLYLENKIFDKWVHNKIIQKARESYRIPSDRKDYLKGLKYN